MSQSEKQSESTLAGSRRRYRRQGLLGIALMILVGLLVAAELVARFGLGLGDPPLSMADAEIEYLFKPSMSYKRFGNHISYNAYSMRSGPLSVKKTDPAELRVLFLGDSIINGGVLTDDADLAAALLQPRLRETLQRPVYVGNISAGSWGPPNLLAYSRRFGWFDADVVVIVLSSHDYADVPTYKPIVGVDPSFPEHAPVLALEELVTRYVLPRLTKPGATAANPQTELPTGAQVDAALGALRELIQSARAAGARVIVAQHLARAELNGHEEAGHAAIAAVAKEMNVELVQLGPAFAQAQKAGQAVYRDNLHPSDQGQKAIAETLLPYLVAQLQASATRPTTQPRTR